MGCFSLVPITYFPAIDKVQSRREVPDLRFQRINRNASGTVTADEKDPDANALRLMFRSVSGAVLKPLDESCRDVDSRATRERAPARHGVDLDHKRVS